MVVLFSGCPQEIRPSSSKLHEFPKEKIIGVVLSFLFVLFWNRIFLLGFLRPLCSSSFTHLLSATSAQSLWKPTGAASSRFTCH
ncbi:hypothetical protein I3842_01G271500 [Carya illinoinensis]|uniref:Uncharacterized protein n=1 Tax=Carya illinoinensis TaxID=32201 RepID=A0A922G3X2_CARIL|nr:hypothetical protein I3842_01G271500 [Carya illinoinensis]